MDINKYKFSIIIPAYNSQNYIDVAIKSVLNQTYHNFELIIVNDGSTDTTLNIINDFACKDERIKVINKNNGGYVSAVNTGLDKISGDYFLFMGSDDSLDRNLLQTISDSLKSKKPDIIVFKSLRVNGNKKSLDDFSNFDQFITITDGRLFEKIKDDKNGLGLLCNRDTSKAFNTSLLDNQRYFGRTGVDADDVFAMRFSRKSSTFMFIPIIGYYWTIRSDSITGKMPTLDLIIDTIKVCDDYFKKLDKDSLLNFYELQYLDYYYYKVISLIKDFRFIVRHYLLIKAFYFHCHRWLIRYRHIKKKHSFAYLCPFVYWLLSK